MTARTDELNTTTKQPLVVCETVDRGDGTWAIRIPMPLALGFADAEDRT